MLKITGCRPLPTIGTCPGRASYGRSAERTRQTGERPVVRGDSGSRSTRRRAVAGARARPGSVPQMGVFVADYEIDAARANPRRRSTARTSGMPSGVCATGSPRRGAVADLYVFGGAAMALAYDSRRSTRDVDPCSSRTGRDGSARYPPELLHRDAPATLVTHLGLTSTPMPQPLASRLQAAVMASRHPSWQAECSRRRIVRLRGAASGSVWNGCREAQDGRVGG